MSKISLLAIDLAKNVFQVCAMDDRQKILFNKSLKRNQLADFVANLEPTVIVMEACYSSHYWARRFEALGHTVKLLPAQHVTPFVRGNKSDHNDVIAIGEASVRPNIIPVPIKTIEQQDIQCLHRIRERCVRARTGLINQTRGLMSEYGVITAKGHKAFRALLSEVLEPDSSVLSSVLKTQISHVANTYAEQTKRIEDVTLQLSLIAKDHPLCRLLMTIPGIGVINATALYSAIGNGSQFKTAREVSVWMGLTPRRDSSGERFTTGRITKRGNRYLRKQLIHGARAAIYRCKHKTDRLSLWANALVARRGMNKASVAMANKLARLAWIVLQRQERYQTKD